MSPTDTMQTTRRRVTGELLSDYSDDRAGYVDDSKTIRPHVQWLAKLMDDAVQIPGTNHRIGLDGLIGFIPGIGDALSMGIGFVILHEARRLGMPWYHQLSMLKNLTLDGLVGTIPLFGDFFDVAFKANVKNLRILREWHEKEMSK